MEQKTMENGMEQKSIYYISEASKKVAVENHVLRYWEEELQLPIRRNEMGHRCYTEEDIEQLKKIKMLKEQGLQLKAIRTVLFRAPAPESGEDTQQDRLMGIVKERMDGQGKERTALERAESTETVWEKNDAKRTELRVADDDSRVPATAVIEDEERNRKAARLQFLLQHMITEAVKTANQELCTEVKDSILKEMDYQFRMQEERDTAHWQQEEEHYRRIDEMIRERHKPREKLGKLNKKMKEPH